MNDLLPYLALLFEVQKLDIAASMANHELQKIQKDIYLIQKETLAKEMQLNQEQKQWETLIESKKRTLDEMKSKIAKNNALLAQYQTQLGTEKRLPVIKLLGKGITKLMNENDFFSDEAVSLNEEIARLAVEFELNMATVNQSLNEWKLGAKEKLDSLELEEIKLSLEIDELTEKRETNAALLPEETVREYEKLRDSADGIAIAEIKENYCFACQTQVQLQTIIALKSRKSLTRCENCGRILWMPEN